MSRDDDETCHFFHEGVLRGSNGSSSPSHLTIHLSSFSLVCGLEGVLGGEDVWSEAVLVGFGVVLSTSCEDLPSVEDGTMIVIVPSEEDGGCECEPMTGSDTFL